MSNPKIKYPVLQIEPVTMRIIAQYGSIRQASIAAGIKQCMMHQVVYRMRNGRRNAAPCSHGFFWCLKSEYNASYFDQWKGIPLTENGKLDKRGRIREASSYTVYVHIVPNGKRYIGMTGSDLEYRWKNGRNYSHCPQFLADIDKYGWDNVKHDVLATCSSKQEAWAAEAHYIKQFHSDDPQYGYNSSPGYTAMSKETSRRTAEKLKQLKGERAVHNRAVLKIKPVTMEVVERYASGVLAAEAVGVSKNRVHAAARGGQGNENHQAAGWFWAYEDEYKPQNYEQFQGVEVTGKIRQRLKMSSRKENGVT